MKHQRSVNGNRKSKKQMEMVSIVKNGNTPKGFDRRQNVSAALEQLTLKKKTGKTRN